VYTLEYKLTSITVGMYLLNYSNWQMALMLTGVFISLDSNDLVSQSSFLPRKVDEELHSVDVRLLSIDINYSS